MNSKTTLPISEARKRIFEIAEEVQKPDNYYVLTEKGRPKAVVMSFDDFESWQETLEVYEQFPDLMTDIEEAHRDYKSGAWKKYPTLEEIMEKEGFVLADKPRRKYDLPSTAKAKSRKRVKKNS